MLTDPAHSDNLLVLAGINYYSRAFRKFFKDLENYSIPFTRFKRAFPKYKDEFLYSFGHKGVCNSQALYKNCFFTAPFYHYGKFGSNHYASQRVIDLIKNAKKRIWVCAQHFHDLASFDPNATTIIGGIYRKYLSKHKVEFRFLKQVPHSSLADKRRAAIAETLFQYVMKAEQRYNRLAHDKFMIIDDTLLVSTANYTSTQFAFGQIKMEFVVRKNKKIAKMDNFSEVNGFVIVPHCPRKVLSAYIDHFNSLWDSGEKIQIKF